MFLEGLAGEGSIGGVRYGERELLKGNASNKHYGIRGEGVNLIHTHSFKGVNLCFKTYVL